MTGQSVRLSYEKSGRAIYQQSFNIVEAEAELNRFPADLRPAIIRMIHACGMVDIAPNIAYHPQVGASVQKAVHAGAPIFCDCQMLKAGIIARYLPHADALRVHINAPQVSQMAQDLGTTRSAAQVQLWLPDLAGAVVAIGNAPTALFYLLEQLRAGAPKPAVIIACPVGFVGAAESKQALADMLVDVPFLTLLGRRGGSAITAAAINGLVAGLPEINR